MLSILERVRARVVAGDWRGYLAGVGIENWKSGPGCLIQLCHQEGDDNFEAQSLLLQELHSGPNKCGIIAFNDTPGRTAQDVINLIDSVIARQVNGPDQA